MVRPERQPGVNRGQAPSSGIRVYLVEDDALIRECLRAMLDLEPGIEVVGEAARAEQAVLAIDSLDVDVVLMDIGLPGMSGIETTRRLKERDVELSVLVLTSHEDEYVEAIEAGATGYVMKSCTSQQLVQAIKAANDGQVPIDPSLTGNLVRQMAELRRAKHETILTQRQMDILKLVAAGTRYKEIASTLSLSETSVNREMRNIFDRLGVNDAAHAVSEAYKTGLF